MTALDQIIADVEALLLVAPFGSSESPPAPSADPALDAILAEIDALGRQETL